MHGIITIMLLRNDEACKHGVVYQVLTPNLYNYQCLVNMCSYIRSYNHTGTVATVLLWSLSIVKSLVSLSRCTKLRMYVGIYTLIGS